MRKSMILVAAALFLPSLVMADIPPPAGYVESCTTQKACAKGDEADTCGAYYGDSQACNRKHEGDGFRFSCRTNGASTWGEVWCRTKEAKAAAEAKQQAAKDQAAKDQAAKDQAAKDQAAKPTTTPAAVTPTAVHVASNKAGKTTKAASNKASKTTKAAPAEAAPKK